MANPSPLLEYAAHADRFPTFIAEAAEPIGLPVLQLV